MKHILALMGILFILCTHNTQAQIIINEVQYGNKSTCYDKDGDTPDWIELYNSGNKTIDLENYKIHDSKKLNEVWVFPKVSLSAKQYMLVFASNKNIYEHNNLHTNFKLSNLKDSLFLFDSRNQIIDSIIPECVPTDKSLGYLANYVERIVISPTPGAINSDSIIFQLNYTIDTLIVDKPSGKYHNGVEIAFANRNPDNNIYYTINGNEPDEDDIQYSQSITLQDISNNENRFAKKVEQYVPGDLIAKANIIRAQTYSNGCPASNIISNTYFVGNENSFKYNVPLISIITEKDNLFSDHEGIYVLGNDLNSFKPGSAWEREAHIEYFDTAGNQVIDQDGGIRMHGRSSRGIAQKSFRIYAKEKYGKATFNYPFFEQKPQLKQFKTLILRTTWNDWSGALFKDEMCQKIVEPMDMDYSACQTSILYLNGEYWGIYSLRERQDEEYIENNHHIKDIPIEVIRFDYGTEVKSGSIDNYENLLSWLASNDPKDPEFYNTVSQKIDLDNLSDFFIAQLYLANLDFPHLNKDMWRAMTDTSRWRYLFFDLDAAMMRVDYDHLSRYNNSIEDFQRFENEDDFEYILSRLLNNDTFRNNFYMKYIHHMETTFSTQRVLNIIDAYEKEYTPLIAEQAYRWEKPVDIHKWTYNVNGLKNFAVQRPREVMQQLGKNFDNPFTVFPNPSNGLFTISIDDNELNNVSYSIFNAIGNLQVINKPLTQSEKLVQMELSPGIYFLQVKIGEFYFREKLLVQ